MHTHVFFPNRPGTNFQIILDVSSFRSQNTPHPADAHSPDPLSSVSSPTPSPAQPSPAWVSPRAGWQRSKLVNTLLGSSVDFAI